MEFQKICQRWCRKLPRFATTNLLIMILNSFVRPEHAERFLGLSNLPNGDPVPAGGHPAGNNTPAATQTDRNPCNVPGRGFRIGMRFE
jgi:hypothetical protein